MESARCHAPPMPLLLLTPAAAEVHSNRSWIPFYEAKRFAAAGGILAGDPNRR